MSNCAAERWIGSPDGTVTILFTDIVCSTEQLAELGERRWLEALRTHNSIVRDQVRLHAGAEVKFLGDGWMVVFSWPADALRCAIGIQRALAGQPGDRFRVRIGVHAGDAVKEGADFLGLNVIVASRLSQGAGPDEILASKTVRLACGGGQLMFDDSRTVELKGLGPQLAFPVRWR